MDLPLEVWSIKVNELSKSAKCMKVLEMSTRNICVDIQACFANVSVKIDTLGKYFDLYLTDKKTSTEKSTPTVALVSDMEKLTLHTDQDMTLRVMQMDTTLQDIEAIYAHINIKVKTLRSHFGDLLKGMVSSTEQSEAMEVAGLTFQYPDLSFKVVRPDTRNIFAGVLDSYVTINTEFSNMENSVDVKLKNVSIASLDTQPTWSLKLMIMEARASTCETIEAYENIIADLDTLQTFIDDYQRNEMANIEKIVTMMPKLNAIKLALQLPQPGPSSAGADIMDT